MRKVKGVPDDIMMEIDFMIGSIEECNSDYLLPILKEHGLDPKDMFLFIDSVSDEVIVDIYEKLFKSGKLEPFYTVDDGTNDLKGEKTMKTIWARIGMELEVTDEEYEAIKAKADHDDYEMEEDDELTRRFVSDGKLSGESYIPDCCLWE